MPRRSAANTTDDDSYLSTDEDNSDPEDFLVGFAGMTKGKQEKISYHTTSADDAGSLIKLTL